MSRQMDHAEQARDLAHKSLDDVWYEEPRRVRLAMLAQVHATLAVAQAIENLSSPAGDVA